MKDWKRISSAAILFLVLLRLSIGWQFLYEGVWKYKTQKTSTPWTAEGYLKTAQGPLRDYYRNMTGDPDDLSWLDEDAVNARWADWQQRIVRFYGFNETQQTDLASLLDGPATIVAKLEVLPEGIDLDKFVREKLKSGPKLTYDAAQKALVLDASTPLKPDEIQLLQGLVPVRKTPAGRYMAADADPEAENPTPPDPVAKAFYVAIENLASRGAKLSYRQRLSAALRGDPDRVGVMARSENDTSDRYAPEMGTLPANAKSTVLLKYGEIQVYKDMLAEYEKARKQTVRDTVDFEQDHLDKLWSKIQAKRNELVGPVKALDKSLKDDAIRILTPEQLAKGALPAENTPVKRASDQAMWALLIFGGLLMAGFCTRLAALGGAILILSFYMVQPPWPGVPQAVGPEHSLIVNKNLIEVIALFGFAFLPSGSWFGLDAIFSRIFLRRRSASK